MVKRLEVRCDQDGEVWAEEMYEGDYVLYTDYAALEADNAGLRAARMAYASEFPLDAEGEPDVGSIHQNIRALKAENASLRERLEAAPHAFTCQSFRCAKCNVSVVQHDRLIHRIDHEFAQQRCDCWKSAP